MHCLDVIRVVSIYLAVTPPFRQSDPLFVIPEVRRKGLPVSMGTIAKWIGSVISEAYRS